MSLFHLHNDKAMKNLFGPQSGVGDEQIYLAESPFITIQGEGPNIGKNTLFIRFFGCNLANSCGVKWCDTGHSFYTNKELIKNESEEIIDYPNKPDRLTFGSVDKMYEYIFMQTTTLGKYVFTGGEPMLWQLTIAQLILKIKNNFERTVTIEIETNGTIPIETELVDWFKLVHFNISPKVHVGSKFPLISQINNCQISQESSFENFEHDDWILKFVYEGKESNELIKQCLNRYNISPERVYLMPEGITRKDQISKMTECAEYCINEGYNFTPRIHVLIWNKHKEV